ncbi:unnamed protein product [Effrenium voratum]|nr:unnamed protein product [Effrenium voratum]
MSTIKDQRGILPCCNCLVAVPQDRYVAVEYFGSYVNTLRPGLNWTGFDCLGLCVALRSISSRTEQLEVQVSSKSKDNVFCTVHISVQFAVNPQACEDAIYKLANVADQIEAYVADVVRTKVPQLEMDEAFEAKDALSQAISEELKTSLSPYGFNVHNVLCTEIRLHKSVMDAMNEINRQKRLREAAVMKAEADKIRLVKGAEAEADAAELTGQGIARQRGAIIDGLRSAVLERTGEAKVSVEDLSQLLLTTQYYETMKQIGCRENSKTYFLPKENPYDFEGQLRSGMLQAKAGLEGLGLSGNANTHDLFLALCSIQPKDFLQGHPLGYSDFLRPVAAVYGTSTASRPSTRPLAEPRKEIKRGDARLKRTLSERVLVNQGEQLTTLGEHLTKSPLPPRLAKTVLWAILLGCLDDALCVVAAAGGFFRDPFRMGGLDREQAQALKRDLAKPHNSDHGCLLNAMVGYTDASNQQAFCDKWQLNQSIMRLIRDQQNRLYTECQENKTDSFANRHRGNFPLLMAVLCAGIFPNVARRNGGSDFFEAQGGKVEARPHGTSAYVPSAPNEWVLFQELSQMESSYRMKLVSPVTPLQMLLLGGQGPLKKEGKGGGKGQVSVSLLDGWVKFRTDEATADQVQKIRAALQTAFQSFCANPDKIPSQVTLTILDEVAALLGEASGEGATGGLKRAASWSAEGAEWRGGPASRLTPKMPGKGSWKGGKDSFKGGGKNSFKGGWKGGKGW